MPNNYIFTITTGRSGTAFLSELIKCNCPSVEAHHELNSYLNIGVETPDLSDTVIFNTIGNNRKVRSFWSQKLKKVKKCRSDFYTETSHLLAKSGLIENIALLGSAVSINIVDLRRDAGDTLMSFIARNDFTSNGNAMLFYLQHNYKKNLVGARKVFPTPYWAAWYIAEMRSRASFYEQHLKKHSNVRFIRAELKDIARAEGAAELLRRLGINRSADQVIMPDRQNAMPAVRNMTPQEEGVLKGIGRQVDMIDTDSIGLEAFRSGRSFEEIRPD